MTFAVGAFASCTPFGQNSSSTEQNSSVDDGIGEAIGMIVENGASDYSIVIPAKPSEVESTAASELKTYLQKITGVNLPIVNDNMVRYTKESQIFSIGETSMIDTLRNTSGSGFDTIDYDTLNENGFILKTEEKSIFMSWNLTEKR